MKKLITYVLILTIISCSFCGCSIFGKKKSSKNNNSTTNTTISSQDETNSDENQSDTNGTDSIETDADKPDTSESDSSKSDSDKSDSMESETTVSHSDDSQNNNELLSDSNKNSESLPVSVKFIEDTSVDPNSCLQFVADTSGFESNVVFFTDGTITDFKFMSLEYEEIIDGKPNYIMTKMYSAENFSKELPLIITLTFFGSIPTYGISYTDADGNQRNFTIGVNQTDGSLELIEF